MNLADVAARVVDIGSGQGDLVEDLSRRYPRCEFLGVEASPTGNKVAASRVPEAQFLTRDLLVAQEVEHEFAGWATCAVCTEVLEHVDDPATLLRNAQAYMATGCRLVVTVPGGPRSAFDRHIGHRRHFTADSLKEVLVDAGLAVNEISAAGFPFFNLYKLAVIARGERLIRDATRNNPGSSAAARLANWAFRTLFVANGTRTKWGWQLVAVATVREPPLDSTSSISPVARSCTPNESGYPDG